MSSVEVQGLNQLQRKLVVAQNRIHNRVMVDGLAAGANIIRNEARAQAPKGATGKLKSKIRLRFQRESGLVTAVSVKPRTRYGHIVITGSKPHDIRPKTAKALSFMGHYAEVVHHPGSRPNSFMKRAHDSKIDAAMGAIANLLGDEIQAAFGGAGDVGETAANSIT